MSARVSAPPVVLVGAGPGDPGLLTVRAQRALADAQVIVFDTGVTGALLDGASRDAERVRVAAGPDDPSGLPAGAVPAFVAERVAAGVRVVRLLAGDAGDFGEEAVALTREGLTFELVPGVSPAVAAAIWAGIPVADGGRDRVTRVPPGELSAAVDRLLREGRTRETPAAVVAAAGTLQQRTIEAPLAELPGRVEREGLAGDTVLIVGDGVRLRSRLAWFERRPLFGRRIVVTRPRAQLARFAALLEGYGAEVVALPTIRLEPPDDYGPLDAAIAGLSRFAWVLFTSANGVAAFRDRLQQAGLDARALAGARLAAIGPETADALTRLGLRPDLVPAEYRAESLVEMLRERVTAGSAVLLVRAAEARDVLPRELRALGVEVTIAPAYRTVTAEEGGHHVVGLLEARRVDAVTFTSSSTVRGFMALLAPDDVRRLLAGVALAAIGPITAATIAEYGLEARISPREYTIPALAAAIAAHFAASGRAV